LELAVGLGIRGHQEYIGKDDSTAYGVDLSGKYVVNDGLAITFGAGVVKWHEDNRDNKDKYR